MERKGTNVSIVRAISAWKSAEPGQNCVCWNDRWDNCFVIGTVRGRITIEASEWVEVVYEVQSALTGDTFRCDHALLYEGPMPKDDDEKTDESTTV